MLELKQLYYVNQLFCHCFILQGETCNNIRKEFRKGCGSANITQEECLKSVCCYDEADNGTCFDPSSKLII